MSTKWSGGDSRSKLHLYFTEKGGGNRSITEADDSYEEDDHPSHNFQKQGLPRDRNQGDDKHQDATSPDYGGGGAVLEGLCDQQE